MLPLPPGQNPASPEPAVPGSRPAWGRRRGTRVICVVLACVIVVATAQASGVRDARARPAAISRARLSSLLSAGTRAAARDNVHFGEVLGIAAPGAGEMLRINSVWSTPRHIEASAIDFSSGLLRSDAHAVQSINVQTLVRGDTSYIRPATPTGKWTRQHVTPAPQSTAGLASALLSLATSHGIVRISSGSSGSTYRVSLRSTQLGLLTAFSSQLPSGALAHTGAAGKRLLAGLKLSIPDLMLGLDRQNRLTSLKASAVVTETRADAKAAGEPYPRGGVSGVLLLHLAYHYGGRLTVSAPPASQILGAARRSVSSHRSAAAIGHSASTCSDTWTGAAGTEDWSTAANWSAGVPTSSSDVCILGTTSYTVSLGLLSGGGASATVHSLTVGGSAGTQTLEVHGINNTGNTLLAATTAITNNANGAILLDCVASQGSSTPCQGGSVTLAVSSGTLDNAGTITTTAANTTQLEGNITNTGTLAIQDSDAAFGEATSNTPVTLDNQGTITLADGGQLSTAETVTNDSGGSIQATGSGTLSTSGVFNQGAGTTSGSVPVTLHDTSTLNLAGAGASSFEMLEGGDFSLSGTLASSQSLNIEGVNNTGNTLVTAAPGFTNAGSIVLACEATLGSASPCSGGSVTLAVSSGTLFNQGTLTTTTTNSAQLLGNITNTGTLSIQDPSVEFAEETSNTPVTLDNQGTIALAGGAELSTAQTVTNDTGGSIQATGSGTVDDSGTFNEATGITSGTVPVELTGNATLNLTGQGASSFEMLAGGNFTLSGTLASTQSLTVEGVNNTGNTGVTAPAGFVNHGTILIACEAALGRATPCSGGVQAFGTTGSMVNDGTITATAANTTQLTGNVENAGTLAIGTQSLPSTLMVTGNFTQDAGGVLVIPIDGVAAGDFSELQIAANATLAGTLSLEPNSTYAAAAMAGDSAEVLTYGGTLMGTFGATAVSPQNTTPPVISGTPVLGDRLSCSTGTFSDSPASFAFQWNRDGVPISGASASTYTVASADVGQGLSCTVTASAGAPLAGGNGFSASYSTAQQVDAVVSSSYTPGTGAGTSGTVEVTAPPANVAPPTVTGTAKVGDVLSCSEGTWLYGPTSYAYQWNRNGVAISGATAATYLVSIADAGDALTCSVTAANPAGAATSTSGAADVAVPLTLTPGTLPGAVGANPYSAALTACGGALTSCEHYSTSTQTLVNPSGATVSVGQQATFSLTAGTLPPGISLSSQGLLSGAPTQSGSFPITLTVSDPAGATASVTDNLTVSPGVFLYRTDGSFILGGAVPAGSVRISPNGSGAITSVTMTSGANAYVPVTGASGAENAIGLQLSGSGSACRTSLKIAGAAGVALSASNLSTSGCATTTASAQRVQATAARATLARSSHTATGAGVLRAPARRVSSSALGAGTATVSSVLSNGVAGSVLGTGTVSGNGTFNLTIGSTSVNGPVRVTVSGGSYTSELDGTADQTAFTLTSLIDSAASIPSVLPVTPLTTFIDTLPRFPPTTGATVLTTAHDLANASLLASYGFPTGTTAETVVPNFTAQAGGNAENTQAILGALEGEAATVVPVPDRASLIAALVAEIQDGVSSGAASGEALPLGSKSLPKAAGTSAFLPALTSFQAAQANTVPPLSPFASTITQALPVAVTPIIPAAITRIGPQAFTETLTADPPATGSSPFSATSDAFDIEVVG